MMVRFGDDKLDELRERANIVEVIGAHVRLKRAGSNYVGLCPFHNEKTPSFSVNPGRGFFHCFGCGAGGSVFNFVMRAEGLSFPEAVRSLARRFGVSLPEEREPGAASGEREAMFGVNEIAAQYFSQVLWKASGATTAREYLRSRGVSEETARAFSLGFAPADPTSLTKALSRRNLLEAGIKVGLIRRGGGGDVRDLFAGRLMFPIRDHQGRVIAFGGRVLDDRLPKYMNSPESPIYSKARNVYSLYESRQALGRADRAIVVEGYFDAIAVWQAGFKEVVASLGTSLTVDQLRLLGRYTRNVIACFDGDDAGRKASLRALEVFLQAGLLGRGVFIPPGFDPDTLIKERGAQALDDLLARAELLVDYFLAEQNRLGQGSLEGRARAAGRVAEVLRLVANPFEFDLLARKAAETLGISEQVLRDHARRPAKARTAENRNAAPKPEPGAIEAFDAAETGIMAIAAFRAEMR
ncbi:MAG: DNA primase, partial [Candidatus Binataceae bacterium]